MNQQHIHNVAAYCNRALAGRHAGAFIVLVWVVVAHWVWTVVADYADGN